VAPISTTSFWKPVCLQINYNKLFNIALFSGVNAIKAGKFRKDVEDTDQPEPPTTTDTTDTTELEDEQKQ
jgi:hypothetical protein